MSLSWPISTPTHPWASLISSNQLTRVNLSFCPYHSEYNNEITFELSVNNSLDNFIMCWLIFKDIFALIWLFHNVLFMHLIFAISGCALWKYSTTWFLSKFQWNASSCWSWFTSPWLFSPSVLLSLLPKCQLVTPASPLLKKLRIFDSFLELFGDWWRAFLCHEVHHLKKKKHKKSPATIKMKPFSGIKMVRWIWLNSGFFYLIYDQHPNP